MSDQAPNIDLSFATLDELVDELVRRSAALVLGIALKANDASETKCRLAGHRLMTQGLYMDLEDCVMRAMQRADVSDGAADDDEEDQD